MSDRETQESSNVQKWKGVDQRRQPTLVQDGFFVMSRGVYFGLGDNAQRLEGKQSAAKFTTPVFNLYPVGDKVLIQTLRSLWIVDASELTGFTFPDPPPDPRVFTYVSNGDANGICYYLGTIAGGGSWINPHTAGILTVSASSGYGSGNNAQLVDRAANDNFIGDIPNGWFRVDFGADVLVQVNAFSYRARSSNTGSFPTQFKLQGSNDGSSWTDIITVNLTITVNAWLTTSLPVSASYRYLRLMQTAANSSANNFFTIGELEFYGLLFL